MDKLRSQLAIVLSTYFAFKFWSPPREYVSQICDLHTKAVIEVVARAFGLQMASSATPLVHTDSLYQSPILVQTELVKVFTSRENETFSRREVTQLSSRGVVSIASSPIPFPLLSARFLGSAASKDWRTNQEN